jgi:hypothetical protein
MTTDSTHPDQSNITTTNSPFRRIKSVLLYGLLALVAIVGVLAVVIAMQPSDFRVSRSATMAAAPQAVFDQVNNFHNWDAWSPWAKLDPNAKNTFEGPSSGTGSVLRWAGNHEVGEGSMTIVESRPHDLVRIRLDFVKPFEGTSDVEFILEPKGDQTAVTWSMAGKNNFIAKAISLVMDCEKMVGGYYEQGLANIKAIVETPSET